MAEITFTLPDELLKDIDRIAEAQLHTRNEVLCLAARLYLGEESKLHRWEDPIVLRAVAVMDELALHGRETGWDPVHEIRRHRDANR